MPGPEHTPTTLTGRGGALPAGHVDRGGGHVGGAAPARPDDGLRDLLRLSGRGDDEAFAQLYDLVVDRLHGLVLRVVRDPAQADEVTQEVMVDIWRQSARYDAGRGSALGWMLTIAHRRAVDRVRSAQSATDRDRQWAHTQQDIAHDSTSERVERSLEAQRVRRALRSLTDTQRDAIELAYFGGYTHTEVAGLLDVPLGTAKTRIRDGLIRLRDSLGGAR